MGWHMNIKNNIVNYLFDRDYIVTLYDDYIYFFNYKYLDSFDEKCITIEVAKRTFVVIGSDLLIIKMTKEELLIKGNITEVEVKLKDE